MSTPPSTRKPSVHRLPTGTMVMEVGDSHFFSKSNIYPVANNHDCLDGNAPSSVKLKKLTHLKDGVIRFPKLEDCAHFHYEMMELDRIELSVLEDAFEVDQLGVHWLYIVVKSGDKQWTIRRSFDSVHKMDYQLHQCVYDRKFSCLPEVKKDLLEKEGSARTFAKLLEYMSQLSRIAGNLITCGPVLTWMEIDNRGKRLIVSDNDAPVNIPAIGAAHAIKKYSAQSNDEISFNVGDIISIIDKPLPNESCWWQGKNGFQVGFFPSDCVEMIGVRLPESVTTRTENTKPVLNKRGKLISLLLAFFSSRPNRVVLKKAGIVKERVFGCDLCEHLLTSGKDVPVVLKSCVDALEQHGIVDGIYRLSGVNSNIQRLRNEFDADKVPDLTTIDILQDIHCVSSLLKMYFRELPNPLFTFQLYEYFADAVKGNDVELKIRKTKEIVKQLPPPHYRTARFLVKHLAFMASKSGETKMQSKNLAICWAPNLLRMNDLLGANCMAGVGVQGIVTELMISHFDEIFVEDNSSPFDPLLAGRKQRPKSMVIPSPTRLITLEEAKLRAYEEAQQELASFQLKPQKYIDVGPSDLPQYHTVIDLPKKKSSNKPGWWKRNASESSAGKVSGADESNSAKPETEMRFQSEQEKENKKPSAETQFSFEVVSKDEFDSPSPDFMTEKLANKCFGSESSSSERPPPIPSCKLKRDQQHLSVAMPPLASNQPLERIASGHEMELTRPGNGSPRLQNSAPNFTRPPPPIANSNTDRFLQSDFTKSDNYGAPSVFRRAPFGESMTPPCIGQTRPHFAPIDDLVHSSRTLSERQSTRSLTEQMKEFLSGGRTDPSERRAGFANNRFSTAGDYNPRIKNSSVKYGRSPDCDNVVNAPPSPATNPVICDSGRFPAHSNYDFSASPRQLHALSTFHLNERHASSSGNIARQGLGSTKCHSASIDVGPSELPTNSIGQSAGGGRLKTERPMFSSGAPDVQPDVQFPPPPLAENLNVQPSVVKTSNDSIQLSPRSKKPVFSSQHGSDTDADLSSDQWSVNSPFQDLDQLNFNHQELLTYPQNDITSSFSNIPSIDCRVGLPAKLSSSFRRFPMERSCSEYGANRNTSTEDLLTNIRLNRAIPDPASGRDTRSIMIKNPAYAMFPEQPGKYVTRISITDPDNFGSENEETGSFPRPKLNSFNI